MKKLKKFFVPWLLFAMLISNIFTNFLQSVVIIPRKKFTEVSFADMVQQKYSFVSTNVQIFESNAGNRKDDCA